MSTPKGVAPPEGSSKAEKDLNVMLELLQIQEPEDTSKPDYDRDSKFLEFTNENMTFPTLEEVEIVIRKRSDAIMRNWRILRTILDAFEDTLRKRWTKKTKKTKQALLTQAFPKISKDHNPGFRQMFRSDFGVQCQGNYFGKISQEALLWPHLNLEDLSHPKPLLILLNARGRNPPGTFVAEDSCVLPFGHAIGALQRQYLHGYQMHFNRGEESQPYVVLEQFTRDEAGHRYQNLRGIIAGEGLHVLEIQEKTIDFLVKICELILHDIEDVSLSALHFPVQPEPISLLLDLDPATGEQLSLPAIAAVAAYRVPTATNFNLLLELVRTRIEAARDHAWELRQDPGYYLAAIKQSSSECSTCTIRNASDWECAITITVIKSYSLIALWSELQNRLQKVTILHGNLDREIVDKDPDDWPARYVEAVLKLTDMSNHLSSNLRSELKEAVEYAPHFRHLWEEAPGCTHLKAKEAFSDDVLPALLALLTMDRSFGVFPLHQIMEHIDRLLAADVTQRARITPSMWDILADIGVLEELNRQLRQYNRKLFFPWRAYSNYSLDGSDREPMIDLPVIASLSLAINALTSRDLYIYGAPTNGRFDYPADKRRTAQHTVQMQEAEQQLDALWTKIDEKITEACCGNSICETIRELDFSDRILQRTEDWTPPMQTKLPTTLDIPSRMGSRLTLGTHAEETRPKKAPVLVPLKNKPKTRGNTPADQAVLQQDEAPVEEQADQISHPTFKLQERDLKVFQTLFFQPSATATPGQIKWLDFVHAMASTGFTYQSLGGSAWQFTPTTLGIQRGISFHEPHPESKIPYFMARQFGRRLERAYGWGRETFQAK